MCKKIINCIQVAITLDKKVNNFKHCFTNEMVKLYKLRDRNKRYCNQHRLSKYIVKITKTFYLEHTMYLTT